MDTTSVLIRVKYLGLFKSVNGLNVPNLFDLKLERIRLTLGQ